MKSALRQFSFIIIVCGFYLVSCGQTYDKDAIALNNQAMTEVFPRNADSALILLDKATELDPDYYLAYSNMATIYIQKRDFPSATECIEKSVSSNPELAEGVSLLGMLYDHAGKSAKAKEQYQKAVELYDKRLAKSDKHLQANEMNRAWTLVMLGETEKGRALLKDLLNENPDDMTLQMFVNLGKEEYLESLFGEK